MVTHGRHALAAGVPDSGDAMTPIAPACPRPTQVTASYPDPARASTRRIDYSLADLTRLESRLPPGS